MLNNVKEMVNHCVVGFESSPKTRCCCYLINKNKSYETRI